MALKKLNVQITGIAPLILHNGALSDPSNYFAQKMKAISGKRLKTDGDHEELSRLEFLGGLYVFENGHGKEVVIPTDVIEATLIEGAKKVKRGPQCRAGAWIEDHAVLQYEGPRNPDDMWKDGRFTFKKSVKVQRNRIMRTRPKFDHWSLDFQVSYNDELLNAGDIRQFLEKSGGQVGVGDWRPKYGRFQIVSFESVDVD